MGRGFVGLSKPLLGVAFEGVLADAAGDLLDPELPALPGAIPWLIGAVSFCRPVIYPAVPRPAVAARIPAWLQRHTRRYFERLDHPDPIDATSHLLLGVWIQPWRPAVDAALERTTLTFRGPEHYPAVAELAALRPDLASWAR